MHRGSVKPAKEVLDFHSFRWFKLMGWSTKQLMVEFLADKTGIFCNSIAWSLIYRHDCCYFFKTDHPLC